MIHISTGHGIDVCIDIENGEKVFKGLQPHDGSFVPVREPVALARYLIMAAEECGLPINEFKSVDYRHG